MNNLITSRQQFTPRLSARRASSLLLALAFAFSNIAPLAAQTASMAAAKPVAAPLSQAERDLVARLSIETLREVTSALSAPAMEGRGTMQPGGERAAEYIANRFKTLGLKPLGDKGTYLQKINFKSTEVLPASSFTVGAGTLAHGRDYVLAPPLTFERADVKGKLAFVGYGVKSAELKRDDFAGVDLKGKVAVVLEGQPQGVNAEQWKKASAPQNVVGNLIGRGAVAIVVLGYGTQAQPFSLISDYLSRRQVELADAPELPFKLPPIMLVGDEGAEKLFADAGATFKETKERAVKGEQVSRELPQTAQIALRVDRVRGTSSNVVGYLEGSDPKLKEEAIIYTAHYDAYGKDAQGRIFPGAADNALGVAEMIAVAEAFARSPARPRRSVIFLAVTGEEYGLFGAEHWTKNPTWKIDRVAANFNYDGIGTEVYGPVKKVVGFGAEHSDLGAVLAGVTAATDTTIIPDPMPEERVFYRSDHYAFVKRGVPALMILGAPDIETKEIIARIKKFEETDYHQPTDVVKPDWNWEGARNIAVIGLLVGARVADANEMPKWLASSRFNRKRGTNEPPPEGN